MSDSRPRAISGARSPWPAADAFGAQAEAWASLYRSRAAFKDRLGLFTETLRTLQPPPARVLDFGCGPGVMSRALAAQGYDVLGLDSTPPMIALARAALAGDESQRCRFELIDPQAPSLGKDAFEAVVCSSVLEYLPDERKALRSLVAALRPGGCLLVSVPHSASLLGAVARRLRRSGAFAQSRRRPALFSLRSYPRAPFLTMLQEAGLGDFRCRYFETPVPGRLGVALSRLPFLGVMLLVAARKPGVSESGG